MFINRELSNPIFDYIMPLFDNPKYWILPILLCWIMLSIKDKENRYKLIILIPLVILLSDQFGLFIKNYNLRERPWYYFGTELVNNLGGSGGKNKSFPSNHAANISAIATIFSYIYYSKKNIFWFVGFIIMFSRIYIGVHFPLDILAGMFIGILFASILIKITTNWVEYHQEP
tara:strand:+ start:4090 stop:4608 length:519 start_codon:yes stop_codon:yes gene_type:complete